MQLATNPPARRTEFSRTRQKNGITPLKPTYQVGGGPCPTDPPRCRQSKRLSHKARLCGRFPRHGVGGFVFNSSSSSRLSHKAPWTTGLTTNASRCRSNSSQTFLNLASRPRRLKNPMPTWRPGGGGNPRRSRPGSFLFTCRRTEGSSELEAAKQWPESPAASTVPGLVCGKTQEDGGVVSDTCGGYYPPIGRRGAFAHEHDVAAF